MFAEARVIVTGASSGIGRDIAMTFARDGASVALFARREHVLSSLADEITALGGDAIPMVCDVTDAARVAEAVSEVARLFRGVDIVVNSAGVLIPGLFSEARVEDIRRMMDVNFFGGVHVINAVLPIMTKAGHGNIVNISSIAGRLGCATLTGYAASKFALIGFTESLRAELFGSGINASLVVPALVDTEMLDNPEWNRRRWAIGDPKLPPEWVTWGVIAAVALGLAEVEVPPGVVTLEKVAALFPDFTTAWLGAGAKAIDALSSWMGSRPR